MVVRCRSGKRSFVTYRCECTCLCLRDTIGSLLFCCAECFRSVGVLCVCILLPILSVPAHLHMLMCVFECNILI